jgi:O-antigen/teichoic acid export membrane protein
MLTSLLFHSAVVGAYYYAYRMSTQTQQLVSGNLLSVMLASFSKIDRDETRRTIAYERTCATLLLIGMPLCFLQAVLAEPVFHLIFQHKWDAALPLFQFLSIAMAFVLTSPSSTGLMLAQGRYRLNLLSQGILAVGFLTCVAGGALTGDVRNVALAVCIYFCLIGPFQALLPIRHVQPLGFLARTFGFPLMAGTLAALSAYGISLIVPFQSYVATIVVRTVTFFVVLGLALVIIRPRPAVDLVSRVRGLLRPSVAG